MAEFSKIAWTTHTFNPWIGCSRVSEGCRHCYAEAWDMRLGKGVHWGPGSPRTLTSQSYWRNPLRWEAEAVATGVRPRVFCASLADVFDDEAPRGGRENLWPLIRSTPHLDWLLLTKRPLNVEEMLPHDWGDGYGNVWLGVTAENQKAADERVHVLAALKARTKFLSVEPQLEEIDFSRWLVIPEVPPFDWMIFGGESGPGARPFDPRWLKRPLAQAKGRAKVFVKQMGSLWAMENGLPAASKGGDPSKWPGWLRVREFPS